MGEEFKRRLARRTAIIQPFIDMGAFVSLEHAINCPGVCVIVNICLVFWLPD